MPYHNEERRALDRWARDRGCRDFDCYLAFGGTFITARRDIERRRQDMDRALNALTRYARAREPELDIAAPMIAPLTNGHDMAGDGGRSAVVDRPRHVGKVPPPPTN